MNAAATQKPKVVVVMPAYNAGRTLRMTYADLPREQIDAVILVDDGSSDDTLAVAKELGLEMFVHAKNFGYGANQKTCYREALRAEAQIVVMVHPDYQYDPRLLPTLIEPIACGDADVALGSRLLGAHPMSQGMPWWKYVSNRALTWLENLAFRLKLSEYHTGYRAYSREVLETVNFEMNSDRFIFDQEFIAQCVINEFRISEVPVPTRYFSEASSASFIQSCRYGLEIVRVVAQFVLHKAGIIHVRRFDSLAMRYKRVQGVKP